MFLKRQLSNLKVNQMLRIQGNKEKVGLTLSKLTGLKPIQNMQFMSVLITVVMLKQALLLTLVRKK